MPSPLQVGIPGTQELIIVLFIGLVLIGIPVGLLVLAVLFLRGRGGDDEERIERLESEVEHLRERVDDDGRSDDGDRVRR